VRFGLWGARADDGGLGSMTQEFFRHMHPDKTMVIDLMGAGRGDARLSRFPGAQVNHGYNGDISEATIRGWLGGLDVVYAAETWYRDDFCDIARDMGVRTVLHVMPELYRADQAQPDCIWLPTHWERGRVPHREIMPVPAARDRFPWRKRTLAEHFVFVGAPAFHDRNGMQLVVDALPAVRSHIRFTFTGPVAPDPISTETVAVEHRQPTTEYWGAIPASADVLVLPRRYAGLSLPMQEAACLGLPIITLDLEPQRRWLPAGTLIPATVHHRARMVGGTFDVHTCPPGLIAAAIDALAERPHIVAEASEASDAHAEWLAWEHWGPVYRKRLHEIATEDRR
jgi:glycosyltransferase involved in cell wall biosynthesis